MTLSASAQVSRQSGNGSTTTFAWSFTVWAASEVLVYVRSSAGVDTLKTLTTHYTLSPVSYPATSGNVVFLTAPASGETVIIVRSQALSQALDLVNADPLDSALLEKRLDIIVGQIQNLSERIDRKVGFSVGSSLASIYLSPPTSGNDGDCVTWDDGAEGFVYSASTDLDVTLVSSFMSSLLDDANSAAARVTLGLKDALIIAASDETTAITAGTAKVTFYMPYAFTVTEVVAGLTTAQASGSIFTVNVNQNGTTIISTKVTIDNTESTSLTAATPCVISVTALAKGDKITIDVDQIGNGSACGLKVWLVGYQA